MRNRTCSFWACALVVALSVMTLFPDDLGAFWEKEDLKKAGIIAGITLGVGVAIVLISGTFTDLEKIFKKDKNSAWFPDPEAIKLFSGAGSPSGNGSIHIEGVEITGIVSGSDIDLITGRASREERLLMPPLSAFRDPILLWPRFEAGFETVVPPPRPLDP